MRIVWHGHSCFEINDGITLVIDPHDGKSIGIKPPHLRADIVMVSHDHFDHNCTRLVKGEPVVITGTGGRMVKGISLRGIRTYHDEVSGGKRGENTVFRFTVDGVTFVHLGDLGHELNSDDVRALGDVDVLFIPVGGVFTIDGWQAKRVVDAVNPKVAVPMHFKFGSLSVAVNNTDMFLLGIPENKILRVGNEIEFYPEELPESIEYWVFSP